MGRGPLWESVIGVPTQACLDQWWFVLLYVQNYVGVPNTSWYLAVDMQLAWLAPLLLLPLYKWPKQTIHFVLIVLAASCFAPLAVTYVNSYPWSLTHNIIDDEMYLPTYMRVTPYLVGVLLAYFMYPYKSTQVKLNKAVVAAGWLSSVSVGVAVLFTLSIPYQPSYVYDRVDAAFYAGFHRLGWSLFVAWVVFACANGYGATIFEAAEMRLIHLLKSPNGFQA
ncbi:hypothetical protein B566_EDAN014198 [Ephemera danica]|nr:hypothetical protein B566_EDAN014198 [Ephemera danica]